MNNIDPFFFAWVGAVGIRVKTRTKVKKSIPKKIIQYFREDYFIEELNIPEGEIYLL